MNFEPLILRQRRFFHAGATRPLAFRQEQLRRLQSAIEARDAEILEGVSGGSQGFAVLAVQIEWRGEGHGEGKG